jgi:fructosamine-3-kinase
VIPTFRKSLPLASVDRLDAELNGLEAIAATATIRVPHLISRGADDQACWLDLERIDTRVADDSIEAALGRQLAALHRHTSDRFGWHRDNWIGASPQPNGWIDDWATFFATRRLAPQRELARHNRLPSGLIDALDGVIETVPRLLRGHAPVPSMLHGDLWAGNWLAAASNEPVLIDPAVYYGDRECDLAMTRLFGGFGPAFYRAYESAWPLPADAVRRLDLYNLYHVVNHANLFGGAYAAQALALSWTMRS